MSTDPIKRLPAVKTMNGVAANESYSEIEIQYEDIEKNWCELSMPLGDAMYLLSLLKSIQLTLDIPFPEDPRDPNSPVIKPSEA